MTRAEVQIDPGALPARFMELHLTELTAWSKHRRKQKEIVLNWPLGFSGQSTLLVGFEVLGAGTSSPVIRLTLPRDGDIQVLTDYMNAVLQSDKAYMQRTR